MTRTFLSVASLFVPVALLTAQTDRVTVRLAPTPNQTLHTRTSQDVMMTTEQAPPASGAAPAADIYQMTLTTDATSTVGPSNAQGRYEARVVCDTVDATATLNGRPKPMPPIAQAAGLAFTIFYDAEGKVIDVTADRGPASDAVTAVKQLLTSAMSTAPPMTLTVGETATVPDRINLPLSAGAAPGAAEAMAMTGETRYMLTSVTFEGADRIAHLTTKKTATLNRVPTNDPGPQVTFEQRITSEGTIDVNIDRGIVLHSGQRVAIDGSMHMDRRNGAAPQSTRMHGTVTITTDLVK